MIQAPEVSEKSRLGNRIKAARHRAGISQRALAARLGVSAGAVAQWELGSHAPALQKLSKLADALSTSPDELLWTAARWPHQRRERGRTRIDQRGARTWRGPPRRGQGGTA